ncbi:Ferrochelatase [Dillenia turbinata]|uniref:Ferrochelatase n=1 Tax=Dillenia turbinata TaxID=194707 RepID=A0AAN8YTW2_9MAGN
MSQTLIGDLELFIYQLQVFDLPCFDFSLVSEHIQTLEEIDMEYKELALESGLENWGRAPALGCTPSFITDLADAVLEALPSGTAVSTSKRTSEEVDRSLLDISRKFTERNT